MEIEIDLQVMEELAKRQEARDGEFNIKAAWDKLKCRISGLSTEKRDIAL